MDALIKGNDLNKLKERVMLNKLKERGMPKKKKTQGKGDALNNVTDGGYSNQTERKNVP